MKRKNYIEILDNNKTSVLDVINELDKFASAVVMSSDVNPNSITRNIIESIIDNQDSSNDIKTICKYAYINKLIETLTYLRNYSEESLDIINENLKCREACKKRLKPNDFFRQVTILFNSKSYIEDMEITLNETYPLNKMFDTVIRNCFKNRLDDSVFTSINDCIDTLGITVQGNDLEYKNEYFCKINSCENHMITSIEDFDDIESSINKIKLSIQNFIKYLDDKNIFIVTNELETLNAEDIPVKQINTVIKLALAINNKAALIPVLYSNAYDKVINQ
jgi:hypothetical protein